MKSLLSLFVFFALPKLRTAAFGIAGSIGAILVATRVFSADSFVLSFIAYAQFFVFLLLNAGLFQANQSWVLMLPLSRRKIIGLFYGLGLLDSVFFVVSFLLSSKVYYRLADLAEISIDLKMAAALDRIWSSGFRIWWFEAPYVVCALCALHVLLLVPLTAKRVSGSAWSPLWTLSDPFLTRLRRLTFGLVILSGIWAFNSSSLYLPIISVMVFFAASMAPIASDSFKLTHRDSRIFCLGSLGLAFAILIAFHQWGWVRTKSQNAAVRVDAVQFLGALGPGMSQADLAQMISSRVGDSALSDLMKRYRESYLGGERARLGEDPALDLKAILDARKGRYGVWEAARFFDHRSIRAPEVKLLLNRSFELSDGKPDRHLMYFLAGTRVELSDLEGFLKSGNESEIEYGLIWARLRVEVSAIPGIEKGIRGFPERLRGSALRTLSVLMGRPLGLDDWAKGWSGGAFRQGVAFQPADCDSWRPVKAQDLSGVDPAFLNRCVRLKSSGLDSELLFEVDALGWMEQPLPGYQQKIIGRAFELAP